MIKLSFPLEINVETVFDTHFHFHGGNLSFLDRVVGQKDSEIELFSESCFHVSGKSAPKEVSDSTGDTIKSFILFFKVGKLELESFALGENASRFELFRGCVELSAEIFVTVNF